MEQASLRDLMESNTPKTDSFLPVKQFDDLLKSLNQKSLETWSVGGAVCAIIYRVEGGLVRIYRGDPHRWGMVQQRLALGTLGLDTIADSPLGSGVLGGEMARELLSERAGLDAREYGPPSSPPAAVAINCILDQQREWAAKAEAQKKTRRPNKAKKKAKSKTRTRRKST